MIDASSSTEDKEKSLSELDKVVKQFAASIPLAVGLTKIDQVQSVSWNNEKIALNKQLQ
jgi:hypothetical protein